MGGKIVSTGRERGAAFLETHTKSMFSVASLFVASPVR